MSARVSGHRQLPLNLRLRDASSFENFLPGRNREARERLQSILSAASGPSGWLTLWGESGSGKTHLLEAACRAAGEAGHLPVYVPLRDRASLHPEMLEDLESVQLVCVDDVQAIAADPEWERALFGLYERLRAGGGQLVVAGAAAPAALGLQLPDLATRLAAGLVYPLAMLTDADKIAALRLRAGRRGMQLGEDVAQYLLTRYPRDLHSLFAMLERLDQATLAAQRRVTIPFVRELEKNT